MKVIPEMSNGAKLYAYVFIPHVFSFLFCFFQYKDLYSINT